MNVPSPLSVTRRRARVPAATSSMPVTADSGRGCRVGSVSLARALPVVKAGVFVGGADPVGGGRGAVVDAVDRDGDGGRVGAAVAVADRVGERVGGRFADGQALELAVGVVGERAVAVVGDQARWCRPC